MTILEDVDIEPKNLLLFHHPLNTMEIKILNGTGEFKVEANYTEVADFKFHSKNRIKITQKKIGFVTL